ncbi:hypothetical protein [Sphingobacterium cavernae]|uniref:hypothetical protein n=1 Tax=Sphingobacterium cavernae TaxID=2592657 RepID=UPI001230159E|nr:hypothetical protein [Sphingobacterium cavernae]
MLSGNVEESDTASYIHTINSSGLHRTPTEQSYRDAIGQLVIGSDFSYQYKRLKVGITGVYTNFNGEILQANAVRNQFDFEGKDLIQVGVHYKYNFRNVYFFGETAHI